MKRLVYFYNLLNVPSSFFDLKKENEYFYFLEAKYYEFLDLKKTLSFTEFSAKYELHHIIPVHAKGKNTVKNLIPLSPEDHALAHYYRYQIYKEFGDYAAWNLRKNTNKSSLALNSDKFKLIRELQILQWKEEKRFIYDVNWQKTQASRSVKARSGEYFGGPEWYSSDKAKCAQKKGGLARQSADLKIFLSKFSQWYHHSTGVFLLIPPSESLQAIHKKLQERVPNSKLQAKHLSLLTTGTRRTLHGWSIFQIYLEPIVPDSDKD